MAGKTEKKPRIDKFKERLAGRPALKPPAPRPLVGEHPANVFFGLPPAGPSLSEKARSAEETESGLALEGQQFAAPEPAPADDRAGPGEAISPYPLEGISSTVIAPGSPVSHSGELTGESIEGPAIPSEKRRSTGAGRSSLGGVPRPASHLGAGASLPLSEGADFEKFARRASEMLAESHVLACRVIYENTLLLGKEEYITTGPAFCAAVGIKRRQLSNVLRKLETIGYVKRREISANNRPLGLALRFCFNPSE